MTIVNKQFKVRDTNTIYTITALVDGKYHLSWTNSSGEFRQDTWDQQDADGLFENGVWWFIDKASEAHQEVKPASALDKQVSGNHYKDCGIQPIEYIHANNLSYFQGNVVKYVTRYKGKAGKADLEKAIHYLELMIELEYSE